MRGRMNRCKIRKVGERDITGERWVVYELEIPWGATELILRWRVPL